MNRLDELLLMQLDGRLTAADATELAALRAADDATASSLQVQYQELEAALRGMGSVPDVADATVDRLEANRRTDIERAVMRTVAVLPVPVEQPRRRRLPAAIALALAACLLLVSLATFYRPVWPVQERGAEPWAWLVDCSPEVTLEADDAAHPAVPGQSVGSGTRLRTPPDGFAIVRYSDGTRLELFGHTSVRLTQPAGAGKRVELGEGSLRADVRPQPEGQPLTVQTPNAELLVLGTRFSVTALADEGTRVELEAGKLAIRRGQEPLTELQPGSTAYLPAEAGPVLVRERPAVLREPAQEQSFPGLQAILYAGDGKAILGHTARQSILWQPDREQLQAERLGSEIRKSFSILVRNGPLIALAPGDLQRLELWDMAERLVRYHGPNPEPKLTLAAIAPRGEWLAYWSAGKVGLRLVRLGQPGGWERTFPGKIAALATSPDGRVLALGRNDRGYIVDLLDTRSGEPVGRLPLHLSDRHKLPLSLEFSADGTRLVVGRVGRVEVWDVQRQELPAGLDHPVCSILRLGLSADGSRVAAAGPDGWVWVWRVDQPQESLGLQVEQPATSLAFAPDGRTLAVLSKPSRITLWNLPE